MLKSGTAALSKPVLSYLLASAVRWESGLSYHIRWHCFYRAAYMLYCTVFYCIISFQRRFHFCCLAAIVYCPVFYCTIRFQSIDFVVCSLPLSYNRQLLYCCFTILYCTNHFVQVWVAPFITGRFLSLCPISSAARLH